MAEELRSLILRLYDAHLSADGRSVNYREMKDSALFKEYTRATAELQRVRACVCLMGGRADCALSVLRSVDQGP